MRLTCLAALASLFACGPALSTAAPDPAATILLTGSFVPRAHAGSGTASIEQAQDGGRRLFFADDFATDNGPRLAVYLSKQPVDAMSGFVDGALRLGPLQGAKGSQAYPLPDGAELAAFRAVIVWCDDFSVLFTAAPLATP